MRGTLLALALLVAMPSVAQEPDASAPAPADEHGMDGGGGILYGKRFAFAIAAAPGWIFDNRAGVSQGLHAVAYRRGEDFAGADAIMYAVGIDPGGDSPVQVDEFVADDLARFREKSPGVDTFPLEPVAFADGTQARVVGFHGDQWGNVEAVAYLPMTHGIAVLVLSARSRARFDADLADFRRFVASFVAMDVTDAPVAPAAATTDVP